MEKKNEVITFNTTESVKNRIAKIQSGIPFSTRSSFLHEVIDNITAKIEQGEMTVQEMLPMDSTGMEVGR